MVSLLKPSGNSGGLTIRQQQQDIAPSSGGLVGGGATKERKSQSPKKSSSTPSPTTNVLRSVCTSLALIFFGVQICQYGLIPSMFGDDYESIHLQAASLPITTTKKQEEDSTLQQQQQQQKQLLLVESAENTKQKIIPGGVAVVEERIQEASGGSSSSFLQSPEVEIIATQEKAAEEVVVTTADEGGNNDDGSTSFLVYDNASCDGPPKESPTVYGSGHLSYRPHEFPRSAKVVGDGVIEVYIRKSQYQGTIMEGDGCYAFPDDLRETKIVKFVLYGGTNEDMSLKVIKQIPDSLQKQFSTAIDLSKPHTKIVFSAQSSKYFGYQILANAYAFLKSNQTNASWVRLLTSKVPDDLSERFPTFSAPRSLDSRFYNPLNKADVIMKWFRSADAPHPDDTIIVIDPDSWLVRDMDSFTKDVSHGHAIGQIAYYHGQPKVQKLWREICLESCDRDMDLVGVPYLLKAKDLEAVAPMWKQYSLIVKYLLNKDKEFQNRYGNFGFDWAAEMIGYNAACAHLKIKTKIVEELQVRDIESNVNLLHQKEYPSIHVGRAWFPLKDAEMAAPWRDEDDGGTNQGKRIQVWCKCNTTAAEEQPWPIPTTGLDFVSYQTLTLLHESVEHFGPVPVNETFRWQNDYYKAAP